MDPIDVFLEFINSKTCKLLVITIVVIFWTYQLGKFLEKVLNWLFNSSNSGKLTSGEQLTVSKIQFAREVIVWCGENLGFPPKINRLPKVVVRYYSHTKWGGFYFTGSRTILIYWNGHYNYLTRINTLIHEYQHFLDLRNKKDDKEYARELKEVGYHNNIYEKRARQVAADWEKLCYQAMIKKGIIKK